MTFDKAIIYRFQSLELHETFHSQGQNRKTFQDENEFQE